MSRFKKIVKDILKETALVESGFMFDEDEIISFLENGIHPYMCYMNVPFIMKDAEGKDTANVISGIETSESNIDTDKLPELLQQLQQDREDSKLYDLIDNPSTQNKIIYREIWDEWDAESHKFVQKRGDKQEISIKEFLDVLDREINADNMTWLNKNIIKGQKNYTSDLDEKKITLLGALQSATHAPQQVNQDPEDISDTSGVKQDPEHVQVTSDAESEPKEQKESLRDFIKPRDPRKTYDMIQKATDKNVARTSLRNAGLLNPEYYVFDGESDPTGKLEKWFNDNYTQARKPNHFIWRNGEVKKIQLKQEEMNRALEDLGINSFYQNVPFSALLDRNTSQESRFVIVGFPDMNDKSKIRIKQVGVPEGQVATRDVPTKALQKLLSTKQPEINTIERYSQPKLWTRSLNTGEIGEFIDANNPSIVDADKVRFKGGTEKAFIKHAPGEKVDLTNDEIRTKLADTTAFEAQLTATNPNFNDVAKELSRVFPNSDIYIEEDPNGEQNGYQIKRYNNHLIPGPRDRFKGKTLDKRIKHMLG